MPAGRILLSERAKDDLRAIENYIAEQSGERRAAAFRSRLNEAIQQLASMPGMGSSRLYLRPGQRAFPVPPWTIFYEELAGRGVKVVRVIDGDLPPLFGKRRR